MCSLIQSYGSTWYGVLGVDHAMFKKIKLTTILAACSMVFLLMSVFSNGISAYFMGTSNAYIRYLYNENAVILGIADTTNFMRTARTSLLSALPHAHDSDTAQFDKAMADSWQYYDRARKAMQHYQGLPHDSNEQMLADVLNEKFDDYAQKGFEPQFDAMKRRDTAAFLTIASGDAVTYDARYNPALDAVLKVHDNEAHKTTKNADSNTSTAYIVIVICTLVSVLIIALVAVLLTRILIRPLHLAGEVAHAIGDGCLSNVIEHDREDEIGEVLQAMRDMQSKLSTTVSAVRNNADHVATASAQIAQGNQDLSTRTEEQASALEETASAMEELGATVKQNADNAQHADGLAKEAAQVAKNGGDVVERVVHRMNDLNEGAQQIVDIISLIDSIAFQTNLLALNASIEAARAGEQGRGFAVVASEVRNLAQRSADASRQISQLINESVTGIREGTSLAGDAGNAMDSVTSVIQRLTNIMGEISAASHEQSEGVSQVGTAVVQMDQVTQQNAALVEEGASAAASLHQQAADLVAQMQIFEVSGTYAK